jgi:hypothetical protein
MRSALCAASSPRCRDSSSRRGAREASSRRNVSTAQHFAQICGPNPSLGGLRTTRSIAAPPFMQAGRRERVREARIGSGATDVPRGCLVGGSHDVARKWRHLRRHRRLRELDSPRRFSTRRYDLRSLSGSRGSACRWQLGRCTGNTAAPCPTAVAVTVGARPAPASLGRARGLRRARALLAQALISCSGGDAVALLLVAHPPVTAPPVANAV